MNLSSESLPFPGGIAGLQRETLQNLEMAPSFIDWMAHVIEPHLRGRVLEVGAGLGGVASRLASGRAYTASDRDEGYCRDLRGRLAGLPEASVARLDLEREDGWAACAGAFDTAVCLNVLEHIDDDAAAVRRLGRALAPGGRLVILVPQGPALFGSLDAALGHRRRYLREGLADLLRAAGFPDPEFRHFNRLCAPAWWAAGKLLGRSRLPRAALRGLESSLWLLRRLDPLLPWPGQSLLAFARLPR